MLYNSKHNFTAGELSPLMEGRTDFERFKNGCKAMRNMVARTQGPTTRRAGFEYIYDLADLGLDSTDPRVRLIPFIFNELQAYVMVFFQHTSGYTRVVFATDSGLVAYPDPPPTECPAGNPISVSAGDIVYLDMPTGWDIDTFDYAQSGDIVYIAQSGLKPHTINRYDHTCWTVEEVTFTDMPTDWSASNGWPECVSFFQQRLGFGGNTLYRQKVWLSQAGDYTAFGMAGATLVDSDPVTFTLDSESQNQIQWMQAVRKLNIGTIGNEWVASGNAQSAITPTSMLAESPTNQGSEKVKPLRVGLTTLFVEFHGRVVNEFVFDYNYDSQKTSDLSILAPHLTEDYSITRWTYQQTPDSIVWCVREDGELLGLTYQRPHNVVAWHKHNTDGEFIDVCAIPGQRREDDLWAVVKRDVNSSDKFYLERKYQGKLPSSPVDSRYLDSFLFYEGAATDTLTGLDHLEGKTVSVLTNGYVHPDVTVSSGSITLNEEVTNVLVGLYYDSEVSPLMPDLPLADGSTVNRQQKVLKILVRLYKSLGFEIGTLYSDGEENWEEQPFRSPLDAVGEAVPLFSGVKEVDGVEGFDSSAELVIRQRQPLPLTILSVTKKVEVS